VDRDAVAGELDARARFEFLARVNERVPDLGVRGVLEVPEVLEVLEVLGVLGMLTMQQQALDGAARRNAVAKQSCWKDTRVIDDDEIAATKETGQVAN